MTVPFKHPRDSDPEPRLSDMLEDSTLRILMARDGVDRAVLERLVVVTRQRLGVQVPLTQRQTFEATLFAECGYA